MNSTACLAIAALVLVALLLAALPRLLHVAGKVDFVLINAFGKSYSFDNPFKMKSGWIHAPYIKAVNEFLLAFIDSEETKVEFTADDLRQTSATSSMLHSLEHLEYEKIRNRLRTMASLNPIVNLNQDEGVIRLQLQQQKAKLHIIFAPKGQSIRLEKL